jgi:DNA invertase Pin-like site-specific DNA recombinase
MSPEKEEVVKRVFERVEKGEAPAKVAMTENINDGTLRNILRNPYYIGCHQWRGEVLKGKHKALVDKGTWDNVQKTLTVKKPARPHFGFHRTTTGTEVDRENLELLRDVCRLRAKKKSYANIASELKIKSQQAWQIVHDPFYKNVIGADLWESARNVKTEFGAPVLRKRAQTIKQENQMKILMYIQRHGPSKSSDIAKALKISDSAVYVNLRELKDQNQLIEKREDGRFIVSKTVNETMIYT